MNKTTFTFFFTCLLSFSTLLIHAQLIEFTQNQINTSDYYFDKGDFDNDGDIDLVGYELDGSCPCNINIWFNDGAGNFTVASVAGSIQTSDLVDTTVADFDGDGYLDLAFAEGFPSEQLEIYRNVNGQGNFVLIDGLFQGINRIEGIASGDLDNDGDQDLIASISDNDDFFVEKLVWYENLDGLGTFSDKIEIDDVGRSRSILIADIDNDNDLDIVATEDASSSFDRLKVYRNFGTDFILSENIFASSSFFRNAILKQIDSDIDLDIVTSDQNRDEIAWYDNIDLSNDFGDKQIVSDLTLGAQFVEGDDMDNDGDIDLISLSSDPISGPRLIWHENLDGEGNFFNHVIQVPQEFYLPSSKIGIADLNNDGRLDIITNGLYWFENQGYTSNFINGIVSLDNNNDSCATSSLFGNGLMVTAESASNSYSTMVLADGSFQLFVPSGDYTVTLSNLPNYFNSIPASQNASFIDVGETETLNFCVETTNTVNDLSITIYPAEDDPRPGFDTTYQLVYKNVGSTTLSGEVTFQFDDVKMQFLGSSETVASQTTNTLTFSYSNLNPFETRTIDLDFNVFPPPTTEIDDVLVTTATVSPTTDDATANDNIFTLEQIVIGSYDPNDIRVLEGDQILIDDIGNYLHYIIRFQNTGTASAINVHVEHILDDKLDWSTFEFESSSHNGLIEIINGNAISFIFDNINLPDSTTDEEGSNGFIAFRIRPRSDVIVGDIISGVADIYFDFNPPIITNTANTEITTLLSLQQAAFQGFQMIPNPAKNEVMISSNSLIDTIIIQDLNGRILNKLNVTSWQFNIQIDHLSEGIYFVQVVSGQSKLTKKLIIH